MQADAANLPDSESLLPASMQENRGSGRRSERMRLDLLLVERGLCESREQARRLIMAGEVTVTGAVVDKPGHAVPRNAEVAVRAQPRYVSRGGLKLEAALDAFALDVRGMTAVDVGASTGGFTDCLLQRGAARVYAVDVGYGQLAWKLRSDSRVLPIERTNIRYLTELPAGVLADIAVIDASFISLTLVLEPALRLLKPGAGIVALVKPQFEAGRDQVGAGGVVRDAGVHRRVLEEATAFAAGLGLAAAGLIASPAPGPAGNIEFLLWLVPSAASIHVSAAFDLGIAIDRALAQAERLRAKRSA